MRKLLIATPIFLLSLLTSCTTSTPVEHIVVHPDGTPIGETVDHSHHHSTHTVTSEEDFLTGMIPHHQEAVDTSERLHAITQEPALLGLTEAIVADQKREIAMMQDWLGEWYPDHNTVSNYTPMMRDTSAISATPTIEKMWLEDMIVHHEWAVKMAESVLALNPRDEVREYAESIIANQSREITEMQSLLHNYH